MSNTITSPSSCNYFNNGGKTRQRERSCSNLPPIRKNIDHPQLSFKFNTKYQVSRYIIFFLYITQISSYMLNYSAELCALNPGLLLHRRLHLLRRALLPHHHGKTNIRMIIFCFNLLCDLHEINGLVMQEKMVMGISTNRHPACSWPQGRPSTQPKRLFPAI